MDELLKLRWWHPKVHMYAQAPRQNTNMYRHSSKANLAMFSHRAPRAFKFNFESNLQWQSTNSSWLVSPAARHIQVKWRLRRYSSIESTFPSRTILVPAPHVMTEQSNGTQPPTFELCRCCPSLKSPTSYQNGCFEHSLRISMVGST